MLNLGTVITTARKSNIVTDVVAQRLFSLVYFSEEIENSAVDAIVALLAESIQNGDQVRSPVLIATTIANIIRSRPPR